MAYLDYKKIRRKLWETNEKYVIERTDGMVDEHMKAQLAFNIGVNATLELVEKILKEENQPR